MNDAAFEALNALLLAQARAVRDADAKLGGHHGLSLSELTLLAALDRRTDHRARPSELARDLHLTASGVTRALLPLEKRGILKREADPGDGRSTFAALTPAGRKLVADATGTAAEAGTRLMKRLSLGQTRQLIRLLEEIGA